jgi:tetratricopeptide (TPR) repeat protein
MNDVGRAMEYYHKALEITERIGEQHLSAEIYANLGLLYNQQGDKAQARAHYQKSKALLEMVGNPLQVQEMAQRIRRL